MITADQLVAHAVGDYILQSDWMATEKTKQSIAALAHVLAYGVPFAIIGASMPAMAVIVGTHFVIDRWRLARYVVWAKNVILGSYQPWSECSQTGYRKDRPPWMSVWLLIITDNIMHVICNGLAMAYL